MYKSSTEIQEVSGHYSQILNKKSPMQNIPGVNKRSQKISTKKKFTEVGNFVNLVNFSDLLCFAPKRKDFENYIVYISNRFRRRY